MILIIGKKRKDNKYKVSYRFEYKTINTLQTMEKIQEEITKDKLIHLGNNTYSNERMV